MAGPCTALALLRGWEASQCSRRRVAPKRSPSNAAARRRLPAGPAGPRLRTERKNTPSHLLPKPRPHTPVNTMTRAQDKTHPHPTPPHAQHTPAHDDDVAAALADHAGGRVVLLPQRVAARRQLHPGRHVDEARRARPALPAGGGHCRAQRGMAGRGGADVEDEVGERGSNRGPHTAVPATATDCTRAPTCTSSGLASPPPPKLHRNYIRTPSCSSRPSGQSPHHTPAHAHQR